MDFNNYLLLKFDKKDNNFVLDYNLNTPVFFKNYDTHKIAIIGHLYINSLCGQGVVEKVYELFNNKNYSKLENLNGEFVVIIEYITDGKIYIINSRFASPHIFYYADDKSFFASNNYSLLIKELLKLNKVKLNSEAFWEVIYFRRLYTNKTLDNASKYLPGASVLSWSITQGIKIHKYWNIKYKHDYLSFSDGVHYLKNSLQTAIKNKQLDNKRNALMLSGGMDTRVLLSQGKFDAAFTATITKNREYKVAKEVAKYKNIPHYWLNYKVEQYSKYIDFSSALIGSMFMADGVFYGFSNKIKSVCDVTFAGYGLDYFFQGMYLPTRKFYVKNKPLYFSLPLKKPPKNLSKYYLENISFRSKGVAVDDIMLAAGEMREYLEGEISKDLAISKNFSDSWLDNWEFLNFGNVSRHYTYGGQLAHMEMCDYRTIAYDNEVYDVYLSVPNKYRYDSKLMRELLKISDTFLYNYISANHGFPIKYSGLQKTIAHSFDFLKRKLFLKPKAKFERTWLEGDAVINTVLYDDILKLAKSETLAQLNIIDMDKLALAIENWKNKKIVGGQTFMMLLTVERFLNFIHDK